MNNCWFTLSDSEEFLKESLGLAISLVRARSKYPLCIMIPANAAKNLNLDNFSKRIAKYNAFIKIIPSILADPITPSAYNMTLNKFYILNFTEYNKVCFIDADNIVMSNIDYLFDNKYPTFRFAKYDVITKLPLPPHAIKPMGDILLFKPDLNLYGYIISICFKEQFPTDEYVIRHLLEAKIIPYERLSTEIQQKIYDDTGIPKYLAQFSYDEIEKIVNNFNAQEFYSIWGEKFFAQDLIRNNNLNPYLINQKRYLQSWKTELYNAQL